ncbi:MAG: tetratricopeptide repeat protein, partial [Chlamydiae bacterium]|nr:tetratricopeptide repeat protein [Chlamydiota bacterium]
MDGLCLNICHIVFGIWRTSRLLGMILFVYIDKVRIAHGPKLLKKSKKNYWIIMDHSEFFHKGCQLISEARYFEALDLTDKALQLYPNSPELHFNKGLVLSFQENTKLAIAHFENALMLEPKMSFALLNLAYLYINQGDFPKAVDYTSRCLCIDPYEFRAYFYKGLSFERSLLWEEALQAYTLCLSLNSNFFEAYVNKGNVLFHLKRFEESIQTYRQAQAIKNDISLLMNIGVCLQNCNKLEEALNVYQECLKLDENQYMACFQMGNVYFALKDYKLSIKWYDRCIVINPTFHDAFYNLAICLQQLKEFKRAVTTYDFFLKLRPERQDAYLGYGQCLFEIGMFDEATRVISDFINVCPQDYNAFLIRGIAFLWGKKFNEAINDFSKAIELNEDLACAKWNKALTLLLLGQYEIGLDLYEHRRELPNLKSDFYRVSGIELDHLDVSGKIVYVYPEQGFGDIIQFSRYLILLSKMGARVIFGAPYPLKALLKSLDSDIDIIDRDDPVPYNNFICPIGSLPRLFKTRRDSIPSLSSYLIPSNPKVARFTAILGQKSKIRVGFVFAGSKFHFRDHIRSISCSEFLKIFPEEVDSICLQSEISQENKGLLESFGARSLDKYLDDFSDTAALIVNMDLVIT